MPRNCTIVGTVAHATRTRRRGSWRFSSGVRGTAARCNGANAKADAMSGADEMLSAAMAGIDAANARDPNAVEVDAQREPAELVYGRRMSEALSRLAPAASPHLKLAVRGQHIERWTSPRKSYPEGRAGYLQWRQDLKAFHARRVGEIMRAAGYGDD